MSTNLDVGTDRHLETVVVGDTRRSTRSLLGDILAFARERKYTGWDYGDGMSSRILQSLPFDNKWVNLAFQETIKRAPVNVRPLFLVERRRNYKGTALFAMANHTSHQLRSGDANAGRDVDYREEAVDLVDWLVENRSVGYSGFCGGHKHEIQHLDGRGIPNDPDVVSTSYAVKALLAASTIDQRYADVARTAARFVTDDLEYREVDSGAVINYHMNHPDEYATLNAVALGARLFVDLYDHFGDEQLRERATKLLHFVADKQTELGGWPYRFPASASHLSMDNHHNGFIVESLLRYREVTGESRFDGTLDRALSFYRETLFDEDGAPNFDEENAFPRDVHASAQGILTFTYAGDLAFARRILEWTLENMYVSDEGRFYYRKHRLYTKRFTLMRWCQAWMAYAVSEYLSAISDRR